MGKCKEKDIVRRMKTTYFQISIDGRFDRVNFVEVYKLLNNP